MLHVDNARQGFFEHHEYQAVLRCLPDYLKPVITTWPTSRAGGSSQELLTRKWRDVDLTTGWLRRLDSGQSKNGQGRMFQMTPELHDLFERQRERVRPEINKTTGRLVDWVFCHYPGDGRAAAGSPIKDFRGAWAKACRDAGVPDRLVHDLRRTAVRNLETRRHTTFCSDGNDRAPDRSGLPALRDCRRGHVDRSLREARRFPRGRGEL